MIGRGGGGEEVEAIFVLWHRWVGKKGRITDHLERTRRHDILCGGETEVSWRRPSPADRLMTPTSVQHDNLPQRQKPLMPI